MVPGQIWHNSVHMAYNLYFIYILHSYLCQTNLSFDADINECNVDNGGCSDVCENSIGSFQCSCFSGFELQENLRNCSGEFCSGTEVMQ